MAGGESCEVVRADTGDLSSFVEAGTGHLAALRGVFDSVSSTRGRVLAALAVDAVPAARAARLDGGWDPLAEQIAEATLANQYAAGIRDALDRDDVTSHGAWVTAEEVDRTLADLGLDGLGPDRSLATDRRLADEAAIRRQLVDVLADLDEDVPDHLRSALVGLALEEWLAGLTGADPERRAAAGRVLVDRGIELRAGLTGDDVDGPEAAVAAMLVTQGILVWPADRGELVDHLGARTVTTASGHHRSQLSVLVDTLDLDQSIGEVSVHGLGIGPWQRANQPWVRNAALILLVDASIAPDGTISRSGARLVDDVLDRYPEVVELADDTWHDTAFLAAGGGGDGDRYESMVVWPTEGIRSVLARGLTAPNNGLGVDEYRSALVLDDVDRQLEAAVERGDADVDDLWRRRLILIDRLVDGDPDQARLLDQAKAQGSSGAEALRLLRNAAEAPSTDDRVRRLRVLYPTDAWGDPIIPTELDLGNRADQGLPLEVARSMAAELGVLQTVQLARYAEGRPTPAMPLMPEQVDLVRRYGEVARWFHHRFAGSFPGGAEPAVDFLTEQHLDDLDRLLWDHPEGFADLLTELARPENQIVWDLMAGADGNDTFLGPDGVYRPAGESHGGPADPQALLVQLALQSAVGPFHADLDRDGDGTLHEDEVSDWLERAEADGSIPPALIDRVRLGADHGLGQDTFGWDDFAQLIGWIGLAAAATATIVYSGGTAAPLWVKAGLVGLAGLEVYASVRADDPVAAGLAAVGGLADLAAAARLLRTARTTPVLVTDDIIRAEERYLRLVELARRSGHPDLVALADRANGLNRAEFLARYEDLLTGAQADMVRHLIDGGASPAQAAEALRAAGIELFDEVTVVARRLLDDAARAEVQTTADLQAIAGDRGVELVGLDFRLKTEGSLVRKIETDLATSAAATPAGVAARIRDALRYTVAADPDDLVATYDAYVRRLEQLGYEPITVKNTWVEGAPYKGVNTTWRSPDGQPFELQFHTPESFAAKEATHGLYEEFRLPETPGWRKVELQDEMSAISAELTTPDGITTIKNAP